MTSTIAKNCPKQISAFSTFFSFLAFLTYKMTSKFKIDLIRPTYFWGARSFCFYDFFGRALLMPQNFILNIFLDIFSLLITFLSDFSYFSRFSFFLHSYPCRRSSNRVCSCLYAFRIGRWNLLKVKCGGQFSNYFLVRIVIRCQNTSLFFVLE